MRAIVASCFACLAVTCGSCHRAPPRATSPVTVEIAPAKEPQTTRLSGSGCSVQLPGSWKRIADPEATGDSWYAEAEDGSAGLSVLPMPGHFDESMSERQADLDAIMNLRREVDPQQRGPRIVLSAPVSVDDSTNPARLYTTLDPDAGEITATMAKASPNMVCVLFLSRGSASSADFLDYAKSVLRTVDFAK